MDERIVELLQQQNQLLQEISSALPSADTWQQIDNMNQIATVVKAYLDGKQKEESQQRETTAVIQQTEEDRFNQIYDLLSSIDGKVPDETENTHDTTYMEANQEILQSLTDLTTQGDQITTYAQNMQNINIPILCGVGMIAGILLCSILSRFFKH